MNGYKDSVKVYDPGLATVLVLMKYQPLYTGMEQDGRFLFGFKESEELTNTINRYWAEELTVEPMEFFDMTQVVIGTAYGARQIG